MEIPDPLHIKDGWIGEENGISKWPSIYYLDISNYMKLIGPEFIARLDKEYKLGKAYRYFTDGLVREVFYTEIKNTDYCILKCRVVHSQSMRASAYHV